MKKYILMFGLTLLMGLFITNAVVAQWSQTGTLIHPTSLSDRLGIGTSTGTGAPFYVYLSGGGSTAIQERHVDTEFGAALVMRKARGIAPNYLPALKDDIVGGLVGQVNRNSGATPAWNNVAGIRFLAAENAATGSTPGKIVFQTTPVGSTVFLTRMIINENGAVGIGTEDIPTGFLFAVNGKAIAEELQIQLKSSWPDFVFQSDYNLMPLNELESFVTTNKHLPGIPSEADINAQGGFNVGETSALLLQKIEELTLYIIELNKRIEELEK